MEQFGFRANAPTLVSAFVSMFLHWNVFHLLANMLFLAVAGTAVEQAAGYAKYATVYLIGGLAGIGVHWAVYRNAGDPAPLIGASACVASCIGIASIRYGRTKVQVTKGLSVPILVLALVWVIFQGVGMFVKLGDATGGVAFAAHIGGLGFGLFMSFVYRATQSADLAEAHIQLGQLESQGPSATAAAAQAILASHPNDRKAQAQLADASQALGDQSLEVKTRLALISVDPDKSITRLAELNALDQIPPLERMKLTQNRPDHIKGLLLKSVAALETDSERPNALLELLVQEPSGPWGMTLKVEYPMHPATEIARARGLLK